MSMAPQSMHMDFHQDDTSGESSSRSISPLCQVSRLSVPMEHEQVARSSDASQQALEEYGVHGIPGDFALEKL
jgi:hypothetical protein